MLAPPLAQPGPARPAALPRPPAPPAVELPQPMGAALAGAAPAGALRSRETAGGGRSRVGDKAAGTPPPPLPPPPPPLPTHRPGNRRPQAPPPGPGPGTSPHPLFVPKERHTPSCPLARTGWSCKAGDMAQSRLKPAGLRTTPTRRQQAQSLPGQWRCSLAHAFHRSFGTPSFAKGNIGITTGPGCKPYICYQ
ncbi:basic salivary proline-rich protein 4-like [Vidua chalybeata]|uniref:basic salivary proline-rich protein 4-like n=1 Tax=Vidua chalybeata TaxID=81927 RepID=UPI0023A84BAD|nr:basic salivary proline-rich protein 4-like [Vidua chalybeata]